MNLEAGAVDEQPVGTAFGSGKRTEDVLPDAAIGPSHEAVIKRLLGASRPPRCHFDRLPVGPRPVP